jgi:hypothetical protein
MIVNGAWRIRIARPMTFGSCCSRSRQNAWLTHGVRRREPRAIDVRAEHAAERGVDAEREKYSPLARTTSARGSRRRVRDDRHRSALLLNAKRPVSDWLRSRRPSNSW